MRSASAGLTVLVVGLALAIGRGWAGDYTLPSMRNVQAHLPAPPGIEAQEGDPVWRPTQDQLKEWVGKGIEAASEGLGLHDIPDIKELIWVNVEGIPLGAEGTFLPPEASVRFVMALTPRFLAIVAGYEAAWDAALWERIQRGDATVVEEIVSRVLTERPLRFLVQVAGADGVRTVGTAESGGTNAYPLAFAVGLHEAPDATGAAFYDGHWRHLGGGSGESVASWIEKTQSSSLPERSGAARWAAARALWYAFQEGDAVLMPAERVFVGVRELSAMLRRGPLGPLVEQVPRPEWTGRDQIRIAVGSPDCDRYAYVDLRLK